MKACVCYYFQWELLQASEHLCTARNSVSQKQHSRYFLWFLARDLVISFEEPASVRHSDPTIPNLLKELCRQMVLPFLGSSIIGRRC